MIRGGEHDRRTRKGVAATRPLFHAEVDGITPFHPINTGMA